MIWQRCVGITTRVRENRRTDWRAARHYVSFDEKAQLVKVKLPQLQTGDIAFQPESATTLNGGRMSK